MNIRLRKQQMSTVQEALSVTLPKMGVSLVVHMVKNLLAMPDTWV